MTTDARRAVTVICLILVGCVGNSNTAEQPVSPADAIGLPLATEPFGPELERRLGEALAARGASYEPRTHHHAMDGGPKYTNRLILESSPYLLQHAHNPVNWYPWGQEAFDTAARLGRPVLLSIGYSTCHWCHVMEEESFEDEEIAAYLNANYIAIKVDREERPDLDAIYMSAVQTLTGRGGWPMTTWLTPEREPYYGGTYFPARDGDRGAQKGFLTLLRELRQFYDEQPQQVAARASHITDRIQRSMAPRPGTELPGAASLESALAQYKKSFDSTYGGTGQAPKFPSSLPIRFLLRMHRRDGDEQALRMATLTLDKMAAGGMYDQLGGGFHRYSVDARWLVPHFEKMLYDNALLTLAYLEAYQVTDNPDYARIVREILRYVGREMTASEGAFHSATDADSRRPDGEMEEGWFFTWTPQEIEAALAPDRAAIFQAYYAVKPGGNFEGRTILHAPRPAGTVAAQFDLKPEQLLGRLETARDKLYRIRLDRPGPLRDDKILTAWNGLMVSAMARAGFVLDEPEYVERAERAAEFLLSKLRRDGRLLRSYMDGRPRFTAYLDDYAFFIAALLDLYESSSNVRWLDAALELQIVLDEYYADASAGGYFMTSKDHERLLSREKPAYDGAEPSGNSVQLMNLLRLHEWTTDDRFRASAEAMLRAFSPRLTQSPRALSEMLLALDFRLGTPKEIVIVVSGSRRRAEPFLSVLRDSFLPNKVVVVAVEGTDLDDQSGRVPLLGGKVARKGKPTAYVCEQGICLLPTTDPEQFKRQVETVGSLIEPGG